MQLAMEQQAPREEVHAQRTAPGTAGAGSGSHSRAPPADLDAGTRVGIEEFAAGAGEPELHLPLSLTAFQRRQAHELAQQLGLEHRSVGAKGATRRIVLTRK